MTLMHRVARLLVRPRTLLAAALAAASAVAAVLLLVAGQGASAGASTTAAAAASYAALGSQEPSGMTLTSTHVGARSGGARPTWPAQAPAEASPNWPQASSIRRLPLAIPGVSGWIASSA